MSGVRKRRSEREARRGENDLDFSALQKRRWPTLHLGFAARSVGSPLGCRLERSFDRSIVRMKNCGRPDRRDERAETSEKEAQIRHSKSNSVIRLQSPVDCREDATSSVRVA